MFKELTKEQKLHACDIAREMLKTGVPYALVNQALQEAFKYQGIYELMCLWEGEDSRVEKHLTLVELRDAIGDIHAASKQKGV